MASMRYATAANLEPMAEVLSAAFVDDPLFRWMFHDQIVEGVGEWFRLVVPLLFARGHTYFDTGRRSVAIWSPPDVPLLTPADYEAAEAVVARRSTVGHAAEVFGALRTAGAHRPATPNWQLIYLCVAPGSQGRGEGVETLAPMLSMCDAQEFPAYLHSTNPRNVPFYERLGFRVLAEIPTGEDGPVIRPMLRSPR